jgi:hypothetical protein
LAGKISEERMEARREGGSRVASGVDGWSWSWVFFFKSLVHFFFIFWFKRAGREGECFVLFNFFML